jgi:hypothetical protein
MKFLNKRGILLLTILLIAAMALGCQGSGTPVSLPEPSAPPAVEDGPTQMPGFPGNEDVESTNRIVAQQDNIQAGKMPGCAHPGQR